MKFAWTRTQADMGTTQVAVGVITACVCFDRFYDSNPANFKTKKGLKEAAKSRGSKFGYPWYPMVNGRCLFYSLCNGRERLQFSSEEEAMKAAEAEIVRQVTHMAMLCNLLP